MIDKHTMDQLERVLSRLSAPITLLEKDSDSLPVLMELSETEPVSAGGQMYLAVRQPALVLACPENLPGGRDLLLMASAMAATLGTGETHTENSYDVYRRTLRGDLTGSELDALSHEYQLPTDLRRCVMVFHIVQTDKERAFDLLRDITPLEEKDVLIDMDRHTVVLIKDMETVESSDELAQFAQALQETLMGETAHQMTVGIGRSCHAMAELQESYSEARRAIEVGRIFQPEDSIYMFSRLILERFLMELPPDLGAYYHSLLFNRKTQRLFNEEMLYTIDMFFKKDLNLSDTARQLYIHRNTLVYRLDKVQRQTGLDLRSFKDAVTFKILMELKKCGGDRGAHK
ncbi:MAG: hypothetical protein E7333_02030 [Clostridiales bacterium]|nr:hypothetical protein [Clostridiales bacterium]